MSSKLLKGTFILTLGTIISKVLGLLYIIPFNDIVGSAGQALYSYSYVPYQIFISIATAGVPLAVSKYISKYNALEEYAVGRKLFKSGLFVMLASGILSFLMLYFLAPYLSPLVIPNSEMQSKPEDVTAVIRAVSFALIIVPFMSLIRGFFQGHESMAPSAVSTVVEQIVRIIFLLAGAFIVHHVLKKDIVTTIEVATFSAFVGAIGSLVVLIWYWYKRKPHLDEQLKYDKGTMDISLVEMYKEIFIYAAPFVIVGIAIPLFQLIDQSTFLRAMSAIGKKTIAEFALMNLNLRVNTLVLIPVSFAVAFGLTIVPSVTKAFFLKEFNQVYRQLDQVFQVMLFLTLPAVAGMYLLAEPVYTVFYEHNVYGIEILKHMSVLAIIFSIYTVTAAILQGVNEQRFTVLALLIGILIKLTLNIPLVKLMEADGSILATALGFTVATVIHLVVIKKFAGYRYRFVFRRVLFICIMTTIMYVITWIVYKGLLFILSPVYAWQSLIIIIICALVGATVYFYMANRTRMLQLLFGSRVDQVKRKLRLKV